MPIPFKANHRFGRPGDRAGHRRIVIVCLLGAFAVFFLQSLAASGWQLFVLQTFYGIAAGGIVTGISASLANCSQQGDEGSVYGLDTSITSGARVVGPLLGVAILSGFGIRIVFGTIAALYLVAALLAAAGLPKWPPA